MVSFGESFRKDRQRDGLGECEKSSIRCRAAESARRQATSAKTLKWILLSSLVACCLMLVAISLRLQSSGKANKRQDFKVDSPFKSCGLTLVAYSLPLQSSGKHQAPSNKRQDLKVNAPFTPCGLTLDAYSLPPKQGVDT